MVFKCKKSGGETGSICRVESRTMPSLPAQAYSKAALFADHRPYRAVFGLQKLSERCGALWVLWQAVSKPVRKVMEWL